jgi:hypothetical protein
MGERVSLEEPRRERALEYLKSVLRCVLTCKALKAKIVSAH